MSSRFLFVPTLLLGLLQACAQTPPTPEKVGADRDAHGCIASAGYAWCARENACVRPWELAKEKRFENDEKAFKAYCEAQ